MYGLIRDGLADVDRASAPAKAWADGPFVSRTVILLGITSLLTDVSAEMVSAVLPLYLLYQLNVSTLGFGVVNGIYEGCAGLVRLAAGFASDRWERPKQVAAAGYGLSVISRLGMVVAGGAAGGVAGFVLLDRIGKGVRSAPRDALISRSVARGRLATAFGVHRSFDTGGSLIGPLVAFGLLALAPGSFDVVFLPSFSIALIGLAVLVAFVANPARRPERPAPLRPAECTRILVQPRFRSLCIAAGLLAVCTVSDAFLYIALQRRGSLALSTFPLLYVGTASFYLCLALPAGFVADRIGRRRLFLAAQLLMPLIYGTLLIRDAGMASTLVLPLLGAYYACTDGTIVAAASAELDEQLRASGLSLLATATSLGSLVSSIVFGALWSALGMDAAFGAFSVATIAAIGLSIWLLRSSRA